MIEQSAAEKVARIATLNVLKVEAATARIRMYFAKPDDKNPEDVLQSVLGLLEGQDTSGVQTGEDAEGSTSSRSGHHS